MSWKRVTVMDQRVRFIAEYLKGYFLFNELCFQFSISRKTGYKWVQRYEEYGIEGLTDRARRPHTCPHKTDTAIVEAIVHEGKGERGRGQTEGSYPLKILIADFRQSRLDEAGQGCISLVEKEYVNPHAQKDEIPHQIEPGDGLGSGRGAETPAGNIQPPDKADA
jgi:transposase-like protein